MMRELQEKIRAEEKSRWPRREERAIPEKHICRGRSYIIEWKKDFDFCQVSTLA
jgi:hypothetical protein